MRKGFVIFPVLVVILFLAAFIFVEVKNGTIKLSFPSPSPTATETPTELPSSTPIITPTPTPLVTTSPSPAAKPTLPPVSGPPGSGLSTINVATQLGNFTATVLSLDFSVFLHTWQP